jgi:ribonuclease BN (tRNA processing enzyme)
MRSLSRTSTPTTSPASRRSCSRRSGPTAAASRSSSRARPASRHACSPARRRSGIRCGGRPLPFELRFAELGADAALALGPARVAAFATKHDPEACPHGLAVEADGRRLVYSGDTGWFDGLPDCARGADLFVCECNFYERRIPTHLSYRELHDQRRAFACERMLLTHLGAEMTDRRGRLEIETADDGLVVDV